MAGVAHQAVPGERHAHAVELGYRHLETDVRLTADGELVAFHDSRVGRVTGTGGLVRELTWAQLSALRVGGREPVPRFAEVLKAFPDARLLVDPKCDAAFVPLIAALPVAILIRFAPRVGIVAYGLVLGIFAAAASLPFVERIVDTTWLVVAMALVLGGLVVVACLRIRGLQTLLGLLPDAHGMSPASCARTAMMVRRASSTLNALSFKGRASDSSASAARANMASVADCPRRASSASSRERAWPSSSGPSPPGEQAAGWPRTLRTVPLDDVLGRFAHELTDRLASAGGWGERFALLDRVLLERVADSPEPDPAVAWAWSQLARSHGQVPVSVLADEIGWSRRHFGVRFREQVGLPPKPTGRVLRFRRAADLLRSGPVRSIADVAAACGYADHSHLIREFRALAGCTPSELVSSQLPEGGGVAG